MRGEAEGVEAVPVAWRQREGEAGGGSRRWSSGTRASTRLCLLAEVEDGGAPSGLANSARPVVWAGHLGRQVAAQVTSLSLVFYLLMFFIFCNWF